MNYTQNNKISQVDNKTLVVGIDIGSDFNYARCFDWRGIEFTKKHSVSRIPDRAIKIIMNG